MERKDHGTVTGTAEYGTTASEISRLVRRERDFVRFAGLDLDIGAEIANVMPVALLIFDSCSSHAVNRVH